jgi:hypothetical protein
MKWKMMMMMKTKRIRGRQEKGCDFENKNY